MRTEGSPGEGDVSLQMKDQFHFQLIAGHVNSHCTVYSPFVSQRRSLLRALQLSFLAQNSCNSFLSRTIDTQKDI